MVATRGRTFKRPWRRSCLSSKLKSSSAPIGRKDSWCFHAVGSSNAPLRGSTAAEGLPRIGRTSIATRWRSCGLPQSASCSENFVIPPDVSGQTLKFVAGELRRIVVIIRAQDGSARSGLAGKNVVPAERCVGCLRRRGDEAADQRITSERVGRDASRLQDQHLHLRSGETIGGECAGDTRSYDDAVEIWCREVRLHGVPLTRFN